MKKYLLLLSVVVLGLSACKKVDVATEQVAFDEAKIQAYIAANPTTTAGIVKDPSGIYYKIEKTGTGAYPTEASTIQVAYKGSLLNGNIFGQSTKYTGKLANQIKGWQIGLLKINEGTVNAGGYVPGTGGKIMLIIPSALAYGSTGSQSIPANSVLIFTIELTGIGN